MYYFVLICQYAPFQKIRNWSATWLAMHDKELLESIKEAENGIVCRGDEVWKKS